MNFEFYEMDVVDSTIDVIKEKIHPSPDKLIMVAAKEQRFGRGQSDRNWISPKGNLYLSIYLPDLIIHPSFLLNHTSWIPLLFARVVSSWIYDSFKIRPLVKWPNDLIVHGEKIAGILCEQLSLDVSDSSNLSSSIKSKRGYLFSLGLNILSSPQNLSEQRTGKLSSYISKQYLDKERLDYNIFAYARSLASLVLDYFSNSLDKEEFLLFFNRYFLGAGEIFKDGEFEYSRIKAFDSDLHVQLEEMGASLQVDKPYPLEAKVITCVSGMQIGKWLFQKPHSIPFVIADVGNSRTKLAAYMSVSESDPFLMYALRQEENIIPALQQIMEYLDSQKSNISNTGIYSLYYASVSEPRLKILLESARKLSWNAVSIKKRRIRSYSKKYSEKEESSLGVDRLALVEYLCWYIQNGLLDTEKVSTKPAPESKLAPILIGVSFGSAITIDVLDLSGQHLGGYILPGYYAYFKSLESLSLELERGLASNPGVRFEKNQHLKIGTEFEGHLPTSSILAMDLGFYEMVLGMLERVLKVVDHEYPEFEISKFLMKFPVVITGGHAKTFENYCKKNSSKSLSFDLRYEPLACLQGLKQMAFGPLSNRE